MHTNIGDRMKKYEAVFSPKLTPRSPLIIRVDGRAFHTYCRGKNKPFDKELIDGMVTAARKTANEMQGFKLAYVQSDECTFLLTDYDTLDTQGWFDYELNKVVSIAASAFTFYFAQYMGVDEPAMFDARAFIVPAEDVPNVFIWRQRDWERNSLQMVARHSYSQKELEGKKTDELHELLFQKGINWAHLLPVFKNGTYIFPDGELVHEKLDYDNLWTLTLENVGK